MTEQPQYYAPQYYPQPVQLASPGITFIVTLIFGVFGLIPALIHSGEARRVGAPSGQYWAAFIFPFLIWAAVIAVAVSASHTL